jgi:hypothetical protein
MQPPFRDFSVPGGASRSLGPRLPLLKLLSASESWHGHEVAARLVRRSRLALPARRRASRLTVFLRRPSLDGRGVCRAILSHGSAFYRVFPVHLAPVLSTEAPLLGFQSPSAPSNPPATSPAVPPAGTAHVYGFSPSSRASFRPILSGLVSSRKHSWGSPFRGFPSDVAPSARRRKLPSCRSHGGHRTLLAGA